MASIDSHRDLEVYQRAFETAMRIFEMTKNFPREENYSLTDQIRRSSRSVAANLTEAWRKRRYEAAFIAKLSDAETEAAETQTWIEFAFKCQYIDNATAKELFHEYTEITKMIVAMIANSQKWCFTPKK